MKALPSISVVVVNHNGGELLRRALESVLRQDYPEHEVIVVDNASRDGSLEAALESPLLAQPSVPLRTLRQARNLGCAGGRNVGVRAASGHFVAFLDADALAPPGWLAAVAAEMAAGDQVGIVASTSLALGNPRLMQSQGGVLTLSAHAVDLGCGEPYEFTRLVEEPVFAMGNGLVARRELFDRLGPFDEAFRNYYEDVDFCLRARLAGWAVRPCRGQPLLHLGGATEGLFHDKQVLLERHRLRMVWKSYGGALLAAWIGRELAGLAHGVGPGGSGPTRRVRLDAWAWNLLRLPSLFTGPTRYARRVRRRRDLPAGFRHSWGPPRSDAYNLRYGSPAPVDLEVGLRLSDEPQRAIAYGFYWPEPGQGEIFRWTNGLGCLLVRAARPLRRLALRLNFLAGEGPARGGCWVALADRAHGACYAGWIAGAAPGWRDVELAVEAPEGDYELLLASTSTVVEGHGWGRRLGLAVASLSAA